VIDVLRAYSTAAWAFELGAERIVLTADVDEALALKARLAGSLALKDAEPVPGFVLWNSPALLREYGDLAGRVIVQRTTAGTVGAVAARHAEPLYCAAYLNAAAAADAIRAAGTQQAYFVITGAGGTAEEDRSCAEYIAALVDDPAADAAPYLARAWGSEAAATISRRVADGTPGVHALDLDDCLQANRFGFVMRAREEDGLLTLRAYN
jgi:2-phosphosulfolactate phosphatase